MTKTAVSIVGYLLLLAAGYMLLAFLLLLAPIVGNFLSHGFDNSELRRSQQMYYAAAPTRSIWQADAGCAVVDEVVGYTAKLGVCKFRNHEFDTELHYTADGWRHPEDPIADLGKLLILGDSQAMGWGVNFDKNFGYLLGERGYKVRNYAVSSHATEQQLQLAVNSPFFAEANIILLQYCENDLGKNKRDLSSYLEREKRVFLSQQTERPISSLQKVSNAAAMLIENFSFSVLLQAPVKFLAAIGLDHRSPTYSRMQTEEHKAYLVGVLKKFPELQSKRVLAFYSNGWGKPFFEWGQKLGGVELLELGLERRHYHKIDDHLTEYGHEYIASKLASVLTKEYP
jgi:hypothetical protein